jgi:hypothetical protein
VSSQRKTNRQKKPSAWQADIERSVGDYNAWYAAKVPDMFAAERGRAVEEVAAAMGATNDLREFDGSALAARPFLLFVARMSVSPVLARDRFIGFSGANKSLVESMERHQRIPPRSRNVAAQLDEMADFLRPLFDPSLLAWLGDRRGPSSDERDKVRLVVGDRLAHALYLPLLRNAQEARQKALMREYLESAGFTESKAAAFEMPPGTFALGRNVPATREDGQPQNLPVDCVVSPLDERPLACVELKSAGDFANVNKRRKEESAKAEALRRAHGEKAVFLLQLFGYFDKNYLGFEASAGIDWAWDHRLSDLAPYFGIS